MRVLLLLSLLTVGCGPTIGPTAYFVTDVWPYNSKGAIVTKTCVLSAWAQWGAQGQCRYDVVEPGDLPDEARAELKRQQEADREQRRGPKRRQESEER